MKKNHLMISLALLCCALLLSACQTQETCLDMLYRNALEDVLLAEPEEVCTNLTPITASNPALSWKDGRVLLVTWMQYPDSYPAGQTITTWWGDTWVTVAPELQDFIARHPVPGDMIPLRIAQLLGMPQDSGNGWFAEVWAKPEDLFRPCPDSEIDDTACLTDLPGNASAEYVQWYNGNILSSYFSEKKYPWTRLGYTYDWGNPARETGLSEYVIKKDAEVIVERVAATEDYCK